jgi:acyl-CoA synthetase (NDP forming)
VIEEAKKIRTKFLVVLSGGFTDKQRKELLGIAKGKFRVIGPNSVCGIINTWNSLNTTFERELKTRKGSISVISQSGGIGAAVLDYIISNRAGFSKFVWVGDMADVNECDLLEYMIADKETKVIILYLESIKEPRRFMELAKISKKPIIVLKSGISEESKERALTHTNSLSTKSEIYSSAFKQAGAIEAESIRDLFNYALMFERYRPRDVRNVAIVSNTGGSSILASDFCHKHEIPLSEFSDSTKNEIKSKFPGLDAINPLDIRADADAGRFKEILEIVAKDGNVDSILVIAQLKSCLLEAETIEALKRFKTGKVVIGCAPGIGDHSKIQFFLRDSIPVYSSVEDAVKVLKRVADFKRF